MKTHPRVWAWWLLLCGLCISAGAQAVSVRAWLDRTSMQLGETVTLNVEVQGDTHAAKPDFSALGQDFDLLGTQSSTSFNIINGQTSSKLLWAVALQPKHAGTLTIPALTVDGKSTQPITLTVSDNAPASGKPGGDVYIETLLEPHAPYVQQQIRLTVKLYYAVNLTDGNLDDPQAKGLVVTKLGQDNNYRAVVGGKQYRVVERHYSLLPENSGKMTLPSIFFRGHVLDPGTIDLFMNSGRVVTAHSDPISIDVRPRPANSGDGMWLPARSVTLTEDGLDAKTKAQVGTPLTLTLRLQAQGLGFEQLPELKLPAIDGADVYPDKTTTRNRNDGEWIYGDRVRKFAIVPNRSGKLTLPSISIDWWDTAHDRPETAQIASRTIDVSPASGVTSPTPPPNPAVASAPAAAPGSTVPAAKSGAPGVTSPPLKLPSVHSWRLLAIVAVALWLLTLLGWLGWVWRSRRSAGAPTTTDTPPVGPAGSARREFREACKREDWAAASRNVLRWAREFKPGLRNLGDLAAELDDDAQVAGLHDLERVRYGEGDSDGLARRLESAFSKGPKLKSVKPETATSPLPPLYPFRTTTDS